MKKTLILIIAIMLISANVYAEGSPWTLVDKSFTNGIDYTKKAGEYFFKNESAYDEETGKKETYLFYSTDGINFTKTEYITHAFPIYSEGLYFIFDITFESIPVSKIVASSMPAEPAYILDGDLNLLNRIYYKTMYPKYRGFYNGYHYISYTWYDNPHTEAGWMTGDAKWKLEKTLDGITLEEVPNEENTDFLKGDKLRNGDVLYQSRTTEIDNSFGTFEIVYDIDDYIITHIEQKPLLAIIVYKNGYDITKDYMGRDSIQSKSKEYLSIDGVYGIEMPEDIDRFQFELNGNFYFSKREDNSVYYCISESEFGNKIKVVYDNKILAFETPPETENDRTLVPMRFLFEQMGAEVDWNDSTQTATVKKEDEIVTFAINNTSARVNDEEKTMDVPARLIKDKTYIPLRFLSEELGYTVEWNEETKTAMIK